MARKLLIVEDDPAVSGMMEKILRLEGYEATVVPEGDRAMGALRSGSFDMVILDVMLPGMDGVSVMRAIRDDPATRDTPVVMLTAKADDETTWAGWQAGCDYYLTKPFDPEALLEILKRLEAAAGGVGA